MLDKIKKLADYCLNKYAWLLSLVLRINFVRLDKEKYTRKVVRRFYRDNADEMCGKALENSLSSVLTDEQKQRQYKSIKWTFGSMVFLMSFFTCFPESILGIVIACAIDIAFFQACLYMAMQRILLLYGTADDEHADETKSVQKVVAQLVKRLGPKYMAKASRAVFIVLRRQGIKWLSIVIAKEKVDMLFSLIVPVTCALIAGIVSVFIFIPMCSKLRKHLISLKST